MVVWIIIFTGIIVLLLVKDHVSSLPSPNRQKMTMVGQTADTNPPITFRYVKGAGFGNTGEMASASFLLSLGATQNQAPSSTIEFWATNHTANTWLVFFDRIEIKAGTNWLAQSFQAQPLLFKSPGQSAQQDELGPYKAGYATVQVSYPTGVTWRAKARVAPRLTGLSEARARIERYPERLRMHFENGDTNVPLNLFATNVLFFGKATDVFSQEVSE